MVKINGSSFALQYKRTTYRPIDSSSVFDTIEDARVYARNTDAEAYFPYAGQLVSTLENGGAVYKLSKDDSIPETDGKRHFKLDPIGSKNDNDDRYVRKDIAETIEKLMTFIEGINVKGTATLNEIMLLKDLVSENFSAGGSGFGIYRDADGNYHLDIDFVDIRKKLSVEDIQVQQSTYVGGRQYNTGGGIICNRVEDKGTYWRCYFKTTDSEGRTVYNTFQEDDQAICETFNLKSGNHYYWRLVTGTGDDYIDLSKDDCASGSDIPLAGDSIVQLGNRTDTGRQGAIVWDSVTAGGPYVRIYNGINSYTMPEPLIDFNTVLSEITARFINQATGKDMDKTLDDMQVNLDIIKQQTDKEYTMWFYDYEPTLSNIPASEWTTAELKAMHDQDLFYNTATGQGYRFEAGAWEEITDHLTLKALEDAAKAQDTADSKRRTFVSQPTTFDDYDVGDIWLNATYNDGTITYKNDALVCIRAKKAGENFYISDWQPSSTATTAYIENLGDRITLAVTDSENGIAEATRLANQGISDAYDAYYAARGAQSTADAAQDAATKNTAAIQVTKDSIAALVEGIHFDGSGNITNINTSGLVTTADFNSLLSKKVSFDAGGHITNISTSGLVTEAGFAQMFSERAEADGYAKRAEISTFITEDDAGRLISNATISADQIQFNGHIVANDTFVVDKDGNLTLNDITANNLTLSGDINGNNATLNDITLNNVTANSGTFIGTVTTAAKGTRIQIDPADNSIKMYNQDGNVVGEMEFLQEQWAGYTNYYPMIRLMHYRDGTLVNDTIISSEYIAIFDMQIGDVYGCQIDPKLGIIFTKNGTETKRYPKS